MQTEGMVARVRKEVEIHSRLKHPSILEVCCPLAMTSVATFQDLSFVERKLCRTHHYMSFLVKKKKKEYKELLSIRLYFA